MRPSCTSALLAVTLVVTAAHAAPRKPIAVGLAPSAYTIETGRWGIAPELIGYGYLHIDDRIYARLGARLGSRGWIQREMTTALRIEERELSFAGDVGLVWQSTVVPSISLQAGLVHRWFDVTATGIEASLSNLGQSERLPMISAQAGLGLPLTKRLLVEPFVRFEKIATDSRFGLRWGFEATMSL
jgi:hypothetical protein